MFKSNEPVWQIQEIIMSHGRLEKTENMSQYGLVEQWASLTDPRDHNEPCKADEHI